MIPGVSPIDVFQAVSSTVSLDWSWIEALPLREESSKKYLSSTKLSCAICPEEGSWENRLTFLKHIVGDVVQNCSKTHPLAIVFLKSGNLLMEFMLGKALFENGYRNVTFFPIDSQYKTNPVYHKTLFCDFRKALGTAYTEKHNEPCSEFMVRHVTSVDWIISHFPNTCPNLLVVEHKESITDRDKLRNLLSSRTNSCFRKNMIMTLDPAGQCRVTTTSF